MKKIIAINAGPRKGWNTDLLIKEAAKGAACNEHMIPVLFIMTSNCAEEMYDMIGYGALLESYKQTLSSI